MESARLSFYEEYKEKGNQIMLNFAKYKEVADMLCHG
jgi:hypothetical protein